MTAAPSSGAQEQLAAIAALGRTLGAHGIEHWLFGGWAVDFWVGEVTREHDDVDLVAWLADRERIDAALRTAGWERAPVEDPAIAAGYRLGAARVGFTFVVEDDDGRIVIPFADGPAVWSTEPLGGARRTLHGVTCRTVSLAMLKAGKAVPRDDASDAAKDEADFEALCRLRLAGRGREPSAPMRAADVLAVLDRLAAAGVDAWIDGGWGVDALLEEQTREHDDLDLVVELSRARRTIETLDDLGYGLADGFPPRAFMMVDPVGRQVDVHPVTFDADGGGHYRMEGDRVWVYPAAGFAGRGRVGGRPVRCLTPEVQVLVHDGYELDEKDFRELYLLRERFGVEPPAALRERVLASGR